MSNADHSVALVALSDHPGYNYDGIPYQVVKAGQKFNTTPARAARLLAKGIAKLDVSAVSARIKEIEAEPLITPAELDELNSLTDSLPDEMKPPPPPEPVKIDKRTKAYRDSKGRA